MSPFAATLCSAVLLAAGGVRAADPPPAAEPARIQLDIKAIVQADGTVADIQPDASLPETVQAMIRRRVATWRYTPARWQGRAGTVPIAITIVAQALPTTEGGYAL